MSAGNQGTNKFQTAPNQKKEYNIEHDPGSLPELIDFLEDNLHV